MPEVTGTACFTEAKQSYNYLIPHAALPQGWNDYGLATLNLSWELDFWGKNRAALAAAVSEQRAAQVEVAQTRLILSTSVASAYAGLVHLYTCGTTRRRRWRFERRQSRSSASGTISVWRLWQACVRSRRGSRQHKAISWRSTSASASKGTRSQRSSVRVPIGACHHPSNRAVLRLSGVASESGPGTPRTAARHHRRASRTEAAARRIDQAKAGFYPSVNLIGFVGVQSLGIDNLAKSGSGVGSIGPAISLPIFNTERLQGQLRGAHAEYEASVATYNATLSEALREVADAATSRRSLDGELAAARASVAAAAEAHQIVSRRYDGALGHLPRRTDCGR